MARFKIVGTHYVSEWGGNNAADGTNPDTPYANLSAVPNSILADVILGTGYYDFTGFGAKTSGSAVRADGRVKVRFPVAGVPLVSNLFDLWLIDFYQTGGAVYAERCIFEGFSRGAGNSKPSCQTCTFLYNGGIPNDLFAYTQFQNCIFLESIQGNYQGGFIRGSYIAKNVIVQVSGGFNLTNFSFNCFNGILSRGGVLYEAKFMKDGSARPDADPGIQDISVLNAGAYTTLGNFAGDPKFIDVINRLVEPDSDLLKASWNGLFLGGVKPARFIGLDDLNFDISFTRMNTTNPESVVVQSGQNDGEVRLTGKISDSLVSSSGIYLRTILKFLKSAAGGSADNNNVPDAVKLLGLLSSEIDKPRRLTYLLRTSVDGGANQSSPISIWDNGDLATPGEWLLMEADTAPRIINSGGSYYGNGDPRGNGGIGTTFNFRAIDVRVLSDNVRV